MPVFLTEMTIDVSVLRVALKGLIPLEFHSKSTGISKPTSTRQKGAVVDWYSQQTRSHEPAPADSRDSLGLTSTGHSP
jgi:hypothetical protein